MRIVGADPQGRAQGSEAGFLLENKATEQEGVPADTASPRPPGHAESSGHPSLTRPAVQIP